MADELVVALKRVIKGDVLIPTDPQYQERAWTTNLDHMRTPRVLVSCKDSEDVSNCVRLAQEFHVKVAAKSGGHGWLNFCLPEGGLCVELNHYMNQVLKIDEKNQTVVVQAGAFSGTLYAALVPYNLAAVGGWCAPVGVGGLIPGGGWSLLSRRLGLACDNTLSIDVVLADGSLVTLSSESNADLFKAFRGGGLNNFGIAVSFTLALHPIPAQIAYTTFKFPYERIADLLQFFSDFYLDGEADKNPLVTFYLSVNTSYNQPNYTSMIALYTGPADEGKAVITGFAKRLNPSSYELSVASYPDFILDVGGPIREGQTYLWTEQGYLGDRITPDVIKAIIRTFNDAPNAEGLGISLGFDGMGGKVKEEPVGGSTFPHRHATFNYGMLVNSYPNVISPEQKNWSINLGKALAQYSLPGKYVNLRVEEPATQPSYYLASLEFLQKIKSIYDPDNLFQYPQGLRPPQI